MKLEVEYKKADGLIPYIGNSRTHSSEQIKQIAASIKEFGFTNPILLDGENGIIAGHGRLAAANLLKLNEVPTIELAGLTATQKKAYIIADNKLALNAGWDSALLGLEVEALKDLNFDIGLLGFSDIELGEILNNDSTYIDFSKKGSMVENFGQPPFSVLDTRQGRWQDRKRAWLYKIGDNGESRQNALSGSDKSLLSEINNGVSILDPVMAEIVVKWFGMEGGLAFDPFAGDSVFGFVCGSCGMGFEGIELRQEQADLNQKRVTDARLPARYFCDSGENMDKYIKDETTDLIFSCPPYADLEVYSNDPRDLSNMSHDSFFKVYKSILQGTYKKLKDNRFAVIVMGEVRGEHGNYIGTIPSTINIMEEAGYSFYNEIIIINPAGTLPMRAGKSMRATRKIGKMHQNILVFLKGDASAAVKDLGEIDMQLDFEEEADEQ